MLVLQELFTVVLNAAKDARCADSHFDGRGFWQFIKVELNKIEKRASSWLPLNPDVVQRFSQIKEDCEVNHFIKQHVNIPTRDPPTITKIIQIALNAGQLLGTVPPGVLANLGYYKWNLSDITTYVTFEDIIELSNCIPPETMMKIRAYLQGHLQGERSTLQGM